MSKSTRGNGSERHKAGSSRNLKTRMRKFCGHRAGQDEDKRGAGSGMAQCISMEFQKIRDKQDFTLVMKKTSKKNSIKMSIHTGKKFPTTAVNKRQLWKQQRKKEVFAHIIHPSGSQHKWSLTFPTSSSGTWLPCMPAQLHINYFPYYFHINKFCCFQGDGPVDSCKEGSDPKQIMNKRGNKAAENLSLWTSSVIQRCGGMGDTYLAEREIKPL